MVVSCRKIWALLAGMVLLSSCMAPPLAEPFATGLNQPRGLAFDAAGNLFVAEAGALDAPAGGELAGPTNHSGRVLRITPKRAVTIVLDGLPFTQLGAHGDIGVTDVAVLGGALYLLTGEGYDRLSRSVLRAAPGGPQPVASIRNFAAASLPRDLIDTALVAANPYAMVVAPDDSALYVADGASGRVLHVSLDGQISVFAELPDMPPLAGLTFGPDRRLYFTMFSALPHRAGSGAIWAADPTGKLAVAAARLTMPVDVAFDGGGAMYVLEFGDGKRPDQPYAAGTGRLLRIESDGVHTVVLDRLNYPTAMLFSPAGDLYIATNGAFTAPRQGTILRVPCLALGTPEACRHKLTH